MNYYPFHIGDFRSGTVNMTRQARWIYRDMLDIYYDAEAPMTLDIDMLCDQLGVVEDAERTIVERLLRFKFIKGEDGYHHEICDQVIAEYHVKAEIAKANGKLGGRPRKAACNQNKPSGFPSGSDPVPTWVDDVTQSEANQEPVVNNQNQEPEQNLSAADLAPEPELQPTPDTQPNGAAVLSIAFRKAGIQTQPADPRLIALAEQGISVETVASACADAKARKPGESVGLPYVLTILKTWAKAAEALKVAGATPQARASPAYASTRDQRRSAAARGIGLGGDNHGPDGNIIDINCRTLSD